MDKDEFLARWYRKRTPNPTSLYEKNSSDLTVFLNHNNKNKERKSGISLEYSLDNTTASKIKVLTLFTF